MIESLPPGASTPFLALDPHRLRDNIDRTHGRLSSLGIAIRPHVKTHKCREVAQFQFASGACGLTVATLDEAEHVARYCDDIFIAFCLWPDDSQAARLMQLASQVRLSAGFDSEATLRRLGRLGLTSIQLMIEVDVGHGRSGCSPSEAPRLAARAQRSGFEVVGCFTFPGHGYALQAAAPAAADEYQGLGVAAAGMRPGAGSSPLRVSGGSTPTVGELVPGPVNEARPGVYVFNDAQQVELGHAVMDEVALFCIGRVIGRRRGFAILDSGSKALGADRAAYSTGFGLLPDLPTARIVQLSEHHAVVRVSEPCTLGVGDVVRVVPNHVCNAVNLHDVLYPLAHGTWQAPWKIAPRSGMAPV